MSQRAHDIFMHLDYIRNIIIYLPRPDFGSVARVNKLFWKAHIATRREYYMNGSSHIYDVTFLWQDIGFGSFMMIVEHHQHGIARVFSAALIGTFIFRKRAPGKGMDLPQLLPNKLIPQWSDPRFSLYDKVSYRPVGTATVSRMGRISIYRNKEDPNLPRYTVVFGTALYVRGRYYDSGHKLIFCHNIHKYGFMFKYCTVRCISMHVH